MCAILRYEVDEVVCYINLTNCAHDLDLTSACAHNLKINLLFQFPITFDHVCNKEQPFFVRSHGWSSWDPAYTQTCCGLKCRTLSIGDFCLVVLPPEITKSLFPTCQVHFDIGKPSEILRSQYKLMNGDFQVPHR